MKTRTIAILAATLASSAARAHPGLTSHPHPGDATPSLALHPALTLLCVIAIWATSVRAIEGIGAARGRRGA